MDRSTEGAGPSASPFSNIILYPTTNLRSKLDEDKLAHIPDKYDIFKNHYFVYRADRKDRIYHNPPARETCGGVATGISEAAFKCGFRVPILPLLKRLLKEMGIELNWIRIASYMLTCSRLVVWRRRSFLELPYSSAITTFVAIQKIMGFIPSAAEPIEKTGHKLIRIPRGATMSGSSFPGQKWPSTQCGRKLIRRRSSNLYSSGRRRMTTNASAT